MPKDSSSENKAEAGRRADAFIMENFTKVRKLDNQSGRWIYSCNLCTKELEHRDNRLLSHATDALKCPNMDASKRQKANQLIMAKAGMTSLLGPDLEAPSGSGSRVTSDSEPPAKRAKSIEYYADRAMTPQELRNSQVKWFRWMVHANIPFNASNSPLLADFGRSLRKTFTFPSDSIIRQTLLPAEAARVHLLELEGLKGRRQLTLMVDGWEDIARRSLYGSVAAERGKALVILSLEDLTGVRSNAIGVMEVVENSARKMEISWDQVLALCTDNPKVMQSVRRQLGQRYGWILTYPCFLHGLNTLIAKMVAYPATKKVISQNVKIVSFFSSSHYWGGQLREVAKTLKVSRSLQTHTETRWYSLVLLLMSVLNHRDALVQLCNRPDTRVQTNGLSPVSSEVIRTVLWDFAFWDTTEQIVHYVKPIVDAIGNLEARDASMADCMLELLRCSRLLSALPPIPEGISELSPNNSHKAELISFSNHAKGVFNVHFQILNTDIHFLCLFLHPLCRKLAISQSAKSRTLQEAIKIALGVAEKWKWTKTSAMALVCDIDVYNAGKAPFAGGSVDGASWWDGLPVSVEQHPLKALATRLWALVPHSAENERLFSNLGGIQGRRRSNLTVETFESLGKLAAHYTALIHKLRVAQGKPI